jgi:hypothetical protein
VLFSQIEYGLYFEIGTFGIAAAAGCILLYSIFRPAPKVIVVSEPAPGLDLGGVDVHGLFSRFTEGLAKGYQSGLSKSDINANLQTDF